MQKWRHIVSGSLKAKHKEAAMPAEENLAHTKWECKYHVVFIPKCRRRSLFGLRRRDIGNVFHELVWQKGCRIEEGHQIPDHFHIPVSIPFRNKVSAVVGFIKDRSSIWIACTETAAAGISPPNRLWQEATTSVLCGVARS